VSDRPTCTGDGATDTNETPTRAPRSPFRLSQEPLTDRRSGPRWSSSNPLTRPYRADPGLSTPKPPAAYGSRNNFAIAGFAVSLFAMMGNPFFVTGIAGIVFSCLGILRARRYQAEGLPPRFRSYAIAGVGIGVLATIGYALLLVVKLH
jgi:hypothetical protein